MHIETKNKDGSTTPHFITAMDLHVARGDCSVTIKPFASVEAHDKFLSDEENEKGDEPLNDGRKVNLSGYPYGPGIDIDAWAYETLVLQFGDGAELVA